MTESTHTESLLDTTWSASHLAVHGDALAIFDAPSMFDIQRLAVPANERLFLWHHPPNFLLLVLPLALLPYYPAYFLWMFLTFALLVGTLLRLSPTRPALTWMLTLAFPATFVNFMHGQTGFLMAALLGGAPYHLEKRPGLAGVLIAVATVKPHLALLVPVALICGGYWRVLGYAVVASLGFWCISAAFFGVDLWLAALSNLAVAESVMTSGALPWEKMPSAYAAALMLGTGSDAAWGAQVLCALIVAAAIAWIWRGGAPLTVKGAALACGCVLMSPYVFDYDLTVLAIAVALFAREGLGNGWRVGERNILILAAVAPLVGPTIAETLGAPVLFFIMASLFAACVARSRALSSTGTRGRRPTLAPSSPIRGNPLIDPPRSELRPATGSVSQLSQSARQTIFSRQ